MIREATRNDLPSILAWGEMMHQESRFREDRFDEEKVQRLALELMEKQGGILLIGKSGMFAGAVRPRWYGPDLYATDLAIYVEPVARGGTEGMRLIRAFIMKARSLGVADRNIEIGNSTGVEIERTEKFFSKLGFEKLGGNFRLGASYGLR